MKPPNLTSQRYFLTAFLSVVLLASTAVAQTGSKDKPLYTQPELKAFLAQMAERNPTTKIKLLDDFSARFPDSSLMPYAYEFYYEAYYSLHDYPQTIAYVDEYLAVAPKSGDPYYGFSLGWPPEIKSGDHRFDALLARASAYAADCNDSVLQTPEAAAKAKDAAAEGLVLLKELPTPRGASDGEYASSIKPLGLIFESSAAIAASRLKGEPVACVPPKIAGAYEPPDPAAIKASTDRYDHIIQELRDEQRDDHSSQH